ncbi:YitT family protein [Ammoniphilus sp. CFH 90114]|uniref:YitT family protein n=1 Tax=Ammoniphilus sp. CFH 90114 TaxID=2493665 RepID=UPI00100FB174|nr:YitT family protein [Ammoniphilus sp. CFH 90114]RXT08086.1 YitT family protein [Ammoniphilus sp. CFH 90114]
MYRLVIIFFSSILIGFAFNAFLLPNKILSGGVSGIAMMIGLVTTFNTGMTIFALNVPIFIVGFLKLGKKFVAHSVFSVAVTSLAMQYIPQKPFIDDPLLASIFGGVIAGIGIGLIFRFRGSTGGFDIIGLLLTLKRDMPLGVIIFALNAVVILISGFVFTWEEALYTLLSIYATGRVIDSIHTRHIKLTLMIITDQGDSVKGALLSELHRGITVVDGEGAFTKERRKILFVVISRYELSEVKAIIRKSDPNAFVNITQTVEVMGAFRRD